MRGVAWGRLSPSAAAPLAERLRDLVVGLDGVLDEHRPARVAVERVFHGANSRSLIVLAEARGALLATVARRGVELVELAPAAVKSAAAGSGRADKLQVARMVGLQLGIPVERLASDTTDALAIAIAGSLTLPGSTG
jgi:crossover junction endodeoxyribonuclease RuvC